MRSPSDGSKNNWVEEEDPKIMIELFLMKGDLRRVQSHGIKNLAVYIRIPTERTSRA